MADVIFNGTTLTAVTLTILGLLTITITPLFSPLNQLTNMEVAEQIHALILL
jgi:hypothetical protein